MRLLMASSDDGYLCKGPDDDMGWTGSTDKLLFRALTSVGGVCAAGSRTHDLMPSLPGREFIRLSREAYTLEHLQEAHPDAWLLGGPTVARTALEAGLVHEAHLCQIIGVELGQGPRLSELLDGLVPTLAMSMSFNVVGSPPVQLQVLRFGS